ncbi:MAG: copper-binding protein [Bryobacteraceae bacterium]
MRKLFALLIVTLTLMGCAKNPPPAKEYVLKGEVLKTDPSAQLVSVKGEKIEGWMDAMTMDYPVRDKAIFEKLKVGDAITAKILVQEADYWVSEVTESKPAPPKPAETTPAPPAK